MPLFSLLANDLNDEAGAQHVGEKFCAFPGGEERGASGQCSRNRCRRAGTHNRGCCAHIGICQRATLRGVGLGRSFSARRD